MRIGSDPEMQAWIRVWCLILVCCCAAAVALVIAGLWALNGFHGLGVDRNTMLPLLLGTLGTAAMSVLLMGLVFYSNASRMDEQVQDFSAGPDRPSSATEHRDTGKRP